MEKPGVSAGNNASAREALGISKEKQGHLGSCLDGQWLFPRGNGGTSVLEQCVRDIAILLTLT